jgi:hypothetical protein
MPIRRDKKGGGTNADGSKNQMYCSHCYEAGAFTLPQVSASQMQERVRAKMKEMGMPGFVARLFTRKIPKLPGLTSNPRMRNPSVV